MLKILQARFQEYVSQELLDVQAGFRKGRGDTDQIGNIQWIIQKARGLPELITCLLKNLSAGQEATVRTEHGTMDWFKIGERVL